MPTRRTPEQTVSDKINAIRARARGGKPPQVCPTCFKPAASPYRTHDERGWIHPATRVHDGTDPERELAEVLAAPGVVEVHSRNVAYGCWMFAAVASTSSVR